MTISGAAASPNMGYHSSPATGFIMTLLNARLGAWLGNPGPAGEKTWKLAGPQIRHRVAAQGGVRPDHQSRASTCTSPTAAISKTSRYTRWCCAAAAHIVVLDSGCDETFTYEDLGNALRKIRIDLNDPDRVPGRRRARTTSDAPSRKSITATAEPGWLVYVKPKVLGDEPPDVVSYAKQNPAFPHQSTGEPMVRRIADGELSDARQGDNGLDLRQLAPRRPPRRFRPARAQRIPRVRANRRGGVSGYLIQAIPSGPTPVFNRSTSSSVLRSTTATLSSPVTAQ